MNLYDTFTVSSFVFRLHASHAVKLCCIRTILFQFRPFTAWMSQVFHMLAWGFPNGKGQNFPPKQKQFQQNGLDKFTSTASNESNHGFHADLEEYRPELFKLPNTQRPHPEDLPLRDVKTVWIKRFSYKLYAKTHEDSRHRFVWKNTTWAMGCGASTNLPAAPHAVPPGRLKQVGLYR